MTTARGKGKLAFMCVQPQGESLGCDPPPVIELLVHWDALIQNKCQCMKISSVCSLFKDYFDLNIHFRLLMLHIHVNTLTPYKYYNYSTASFIILHM